MPPPTKKSHKDDKSATHKLALKGSSKTITEFFDFACNTILFQRGVYPPEDFTTCVSISRKANWARCANICRKGQEIWSPDDDELR